MKEYNVEKVFTTVNIDEAKSIRCVRAKWIDGDQTLTADVIELAGGNPNPTEEEEETSDPKAILTCEQALVLAAAIEAKVEFGHDVVSGFLDVACDPEDQMLTIKYVVAYTQPDGSWIIPNEKSVVLAEGLNSKAFAHILRAVAEAHLRVEG